MADTNGNKTLVLEYLAALGSFEPDRFLPFLAEQPVYWVGMNRQVGREAFLANAAAGKLLYPDPAAMADQRLAVLAEGDWVAVLQIRKGPTNKKPDYENVYAVFCEVVDGKIATQFELLDGQVADDGLDMSVLATLGKH